MSTVEEYAKQIHAPYRKPSEYARVFTNGVDEVWACDSMSMAWTLDETFKDRRETEATWLFVCIDVFSKYLWAVPMKNKQPTSQEALDALKLIISESKRRPEKIWCDQGSEFKGAFKSYCTQQNIEIYHTYGQHKANVAERVIRTIREIFWQQHFDVRQTRKWVSFVPDLLKIYNTKRVHSSIGMTPERASDAANEHLVWLKLYGSPADPVEARYPVGEWVRVALSRDNPFKKGTDTNFSGEIYQIASIKPGTPGVRYYLKEWDSTPVTGHWYSNELLLLNPDDPTERPETFLVHEVLKRRTRAGVREAFVSWLGWPEKYNSWLPEADVTRRF